MKSQNPQNDDWGVYMVRCADDSLYTGIAKDVQKRLEQHNNDNVAGAKYTRARRPVVLVYQERCESRSEASIREHQIKRLSRAQKLILINA
jgi:putative endonuclease